MEGPDQRCLAFERPGPPEVSTDLCIIRFQSRKLTPTPRALLDDIDIIEFATEHPPSEAQSLASASPLTPNPPMNSSLLPLFRILSAATLLALLGAVHASAQDEESEFDPLPVQVFANTSLVTDSGSFQLRLSCDVQENINKSYLLRVALGSDPETQTLSDHELKPDTSRWRAGQRVELAFALVLPFEQELTPEEFIAVRIAFVPEAGGKLRSFHAEYETYLDEDGLTDVLAVTVPEFAGTSGRDRLDAALAEAEAYRASGATVEAWSKLDECLRLAMDDATKARVRDALEKVGRAQAAPLSPEEEIIVGQKIRAEQVRVFRIEAGRMYDRGQLFGALHMMRRIGGALSQDADEAVIGAVNEVDRVTQRVEDIEERLLNELTEEEEAQVKALLDKHGSNATLVKAADKLTAAGEHCIALSLYRKIRNFDDIELFDDVQLKIEEVSEQRLDAIPKDQSESIRKWLEHPSWERTTTVPSHCFLFIGPEKLVEGIPAESKLRFDMAYVFITDLFGRIPNPDGNRITVYFKELFEFGGGVGGGTSIAIGNADPDPRHPVRVDNGLLYHELTHCIDDMRPVYSGFHEGLANLGAVYGYEAIGQKSDSLHSFDSNLGAFHRYFVGRDLEYWKIQNYGPSAGFFLHFVEAYATGSKRSRDWSPMRRFFREYRDAPMRDGRYPYVARALTHYLTRAYGPQVFDDMLDFGFPIVETDRRWLGFELDAFEGKEHLDEFEWPYGRHPNSAVPRDLVERELSQAAARSKVERCKELWKELGIVSEWMTVGPFFAKKADPGAHPFPPEHEIDFSEKPLSWRGSRSDRTGRLWAVPIQAWRASRSHKNVLQHLTGWIRFDYEPYGDDHSAIYALSHITVDEACEAEAYLRGDDDVTLFVNDRRIVSYRGHGANGSSYYRWRGPEEKAPDAMRAPVKLRAGRNKVLVKIRNRGGVAGFVAAFAHPDGSTLSFNADADEPEARGPRPAVAEPSWKRVTTLDYRSYKSKGKVAVGSFRASQKSFFGAATDGDVGWRLFTVRPGFSKDAPSNLLWLRSKLTDKLDAIKVDVDIASQAPPKLLVTLQGEGDDDGLSGWTLILIPDGAKSVRARFERYDELVYHSDPIELAEMSESRRLSIRYWDGWCSVTLGESIIFDRISIDPIPNRSAVGVATWNADTRLSLIELSKGR
ncbi:MAG: hypothetical protein ACI841_000787 [Planctomycetota bacterium]